MGCFFVWMVWNLAKKLQNLYGLFQRMTDEKLNTGPEEATAPFAADPAHSEAPTPEHQPEQTWLAEPDDW